MQRRGRLMKWRYGQPVRVKPSTEVKIKDLLPGRKEYVGRAAADNQQFVNGVLWVLRSGARWHDLPERYGKYKSVHKRFVRWAHSGVWERSFTRWCATAKTSI